jgi:hypothetical protein
MHADENIDRQAIADLNAMGRVREDFDRAAEMFNLAEEIQRRLGINPSVIDMVQRRAFHEHLDEDKEA